MAFKAFVFFSYTGFIALHSNIILSLWIHPNTQSHVSDPDLQWGLGAQGWELIVLLQAQGRGSLASARVTRTW